MMLTDSEARQKKCPIIIGTDNISAMIITYVACKTGAPVTKMSDKAQIDGKCLGSHCMMWRWSKDRSAGWCGLAGGTR